VLVIELEGALDSHSAADFRRYFQDKTGEGYRAFALDCLCLEYISSAGIAAIIDLQSQLQGHGGKMVLFQLATESRQLLRFLKLEDKLTIVNDYDDAIAALTGYRRVIPESDIVQPEELRIIDQNAEPQAATEPLPVAATASPDEPEATTAANIPKPQGNEMFVEEHFAAEKKGLHPVHAETGAVTAEPPTPAEPEAPAVSSPEIPPPGSGTKTQSRVTPQAAAMPEAQELKLNTGAKRLISCPNCKSVLRVAVAGDYLCPACRFRFAFRPSEPT
jgi:anti-anti-sigma factor